MEGWSLTQTKRHEEESQNICCNWCSIRDCMHSIDAGMQPDCGEQNTRPNGEGEAEVFANIIKHDFKSKNPTTRWSDIIRLK